MAPALVEQNDLDEAIALNSASFTLARAVGPALAGLVVAAFGAVWAFGINALTFLPLIVILILIRPRPVERSGGDGSVRAGFAYLKEKQPMLWLVLATLTVGWAGDPVNTLAPAYADMLGLGQTVRGSPSCGLRGRIRHCFSWGGGDSVTSRSSGHDSPWSGPSRCRPHRFRIGTESAFGARCLVCHRRRIPVRGHHHQQQPATTSRRAHEGRVMALWSMAFLGSRPIAAVVDGALADLVTPRIGVLVAALPLLAGWWALSKVHRFDTVSAGREGVGPASPS